jgi:uncharacterized phage protein gp47/JayE
MAELTPTGFTTRTLLEIRAEIDAAQRAAPAIGPNVDQSDASVLGQINGIVAERLRVLEEALAALYSGLDPDQNGGAVQDSVAGITGTRRRPASPARTVHSVTLAAGTYPIGTLVIRPVGTTADAANLAAVVSPGGVVTGVAFEATTPGATAYTTSTLYEIAAPVAGFTVVSAPTAVTDGRAIERDDELRARREIEARGGAGSTTTDAIRSAILSADIGADLVSVYENVTGVTDSRGVAPYSVEAVVLGPTSPTPADDLALATIIQNAKAGGIAASGTSSVTVLDSQGFEHAIGFSRPVAVPTQSTWNLRVDPTVYNENAIKTMIAAHEQTLVNGEPLQWAEFLASIARTDSPARAAGVLSVLSMYHARAGGVEAQGDLAATIREYFTIPVGLILISEVF